MGQNRLNKPSICKKELLNLSYNKVLVRENRTIWFSLLHSSCCCTSSFPDRTPKPRTASAQPKNKITGFKWTKVAAVVVVVVAVAAIVVGVDVAIVAIIVVAVIVSVV